MVVGRKKWWFIPPTQTPYIKPFINAAGFSTFSHTLIWKDGKMESPRLKKIESSPIVLQAGDVLINPPWFWHCTTNMSNPSGCPTKANIPNKYQQH
jgi:hypothetical protein